MASFSVLLPEAITDDEAMAALAELCKTEGIIPAIESAHALAYAFKRAETMTKEQAIVVCLSGRGDKELKYIINTIGRPHPSFLTSFTSLKTFFRFVPFNMD